VFWDGNQKRYVILFFCICIFIGMCYWRQQQLENNLSLEINVIALLELTFIEKTGTLSSTCEIKIKIKTNI